ncbi:hypothetical protein [Flagellimonas sp. GZD32]
MRKRINVLIEKMVNKYERLWKHAKDYARKCRLVYQRMYSI